MFGDLWRDWEEDAIRIGLTLDYFWLLNVKQFQKHIRIFNEKEKERIEEKDRLNHILANYIGFAVNDPKHFPKEPYLGKKKTVLMDDNEMERMARINTLKQGGVINDNR